MRKPRLPLGPQNNTIVPTGHHRPEEFYSGANCSPAGRESILAANARARMTEQDMRHAYRHGGLYHYDPKVAEVREEYRRTIVDPGCSTRDKCCGDAC